MVLYTGPVGIEALEKELNRQMLASVKRLMAIRVCRAYRTAETNAVLELARQTPRCLTADD